MALLDGANNMFGPIGPEIRERLLAFLNAPSAARWDDISSIIINDQNRHPKPRTVWQAVIAVDPTFPRSAPAGGLGEVLLPHEKWVRWPDAITVARAIKLALSRDISNCEVCGAPTERNEEDGSYLCSKKCAAESRARADDQEET